MALSGYIPSRLQVAELTAQILSASNTKGTAPLSGKRLGADFTELYSAIEKAVTKED